MGPAAMNTNRGAEKHPNCDIVIYFLTVLAKKPASHAGGWKRIDDCKRKVCLSLRVSCRISQNSGEMSEGGTLATPRTRATDRIAA
jgi:hypothetical protein